MRILLIEKDSNGAAAIKKGLEDMNFVVDVAESQDTAFSAAFDHSTDLIVISSVPAAKHVEIEIFQTLLTNGIQAPVLCLPETTGNGEQAPSSRSQKILALMGKLQATLHADESNRGAKIQFGPLTLDPVSHKVWRNQKEINLTPKEYTLLEFFIRHPNQIILAP